MEKLLEKISSFNLFTNLYPGVIFCFISQNLLKIPLIQSDPFVGAFLYYFIGMTISRIGSILIEPVLEKLRFVHYPKYEDFLAASGNDTKINDLLETNNSYRSVISLLFCVVFTYLYTFLGNIWPVLISYEYHIIVALLLVLFLFAYKKNTRYIRNRVSNYVNQKNTGND